MPSPGAEYFHDQSFPRSRLHYDTCHRVEVLASISFIFEGPDFVGELQLPSPGYVLWSVSNPHKPAYCACHRVEVYLVGRSSSQGMSLNRSQFGGCSTKYNTPAGN